MGAINPDGEVYPATRRQLPESIEAGRQRIDEIDEQLLELLSQRADVALSIAAIKGIGHGSGTDVNRERDIVGQMMERNQGPFSDQQISGFFFHIIDETKRIQRAQASGPGAEIIESGVSSV